MRTRLIVLLAFVLLLLSLPGCAAAGLVGAMSDSYERTKQIEVLPQYKGLADKTIAVVVNSDLTVRYEYPMAVANITANLTQRIGENVEGAQMLTPRAVLSWQHNTPSWSAMPYGEMTRQLGVERVVLVDIYEYRLHPPGNAYLWQGVCAANVGILERDSFDPDIPAKEFSVTGKFPPMDYVPQEGGNAEAIEIGMLTQFVKRTGWLFYKHLEPKYPDP